MKSSPEAEGRSARWGRRAVRVAALVTRLVPRRLGYALADGLALLAYALAGRYRRAALANLSQVLGQPTSHPAVRAAARGCFRTSARNFWDLCSLQHTSPSRFATRVAVDPDAWPLLHRLHAEGRGIIIVTAHLGSFDSTTQLLATRGIPYLMLTAQTTADWLFVAVTRLRASWGGTVVPVSAGALRRVLTHLRRGHMIGLVADRDIERTGRRVTYFGRPTTLPSGPVRFALETGAALAVVFCPRQGDGYRFLLRQVPLVRSGDLGHDLEENLATLAAIFEEAVRAWPDQWVIFERVWAEAPPARADLRAGRRPA